MPDDRMQHFFDQIAQMPVRVPPEERVLARGQQRRRRARLQASAVAGTIMVAASVGTPQLPGSLAVGAGHGNPRLAVGAPGAPYPSFGVDSGLPLPGAATSLTHQSSQPEMSAAPSSQSNAASELLPPRGDGPLILGLDSARRYVMTRVGSASAPIGVSGLNAAPGSAAVLATNPAGGWVVTVSSTRPTQRSGPVRLAVVAMTGRSVPFGPKFTRVAVTSAAVSQDGNRVAVAVAARSGPARIDVMPLPGRRGSLRSWSVPTAHADRVTDLSWAPDGRRLDYLASERTGSAGSPGMLDTAARASAAPAITPWAVDWKAGATCAPQAAAWLGRSGRYAVLLACASTRTAVLVTIRAGAGTPAGKPLVVAHRIGCATASLDPSASGDRILISYCGLYLDDHGKLTKAPAGLTAAALSG
jgi:hypothetical protein